MSKTNNDIMLAISVPPFWHCGRTIRGNSLHTLAALAPALFMSILLWGIPALRVAALSVFTAMTVEFLCQKAVAKVQGCQGQVGGAGGAEKGHGLPGTVGKYRRGAFGNL